MSCGAGRLLARGWAGDSVRFADGNALPPSGIRLLHSRDKAFVPWAWGINESASVMGTLLSLFLAIKVEFSMLRPAGSRTL